MVELSQIHDPADIRGLTLTECVELGDDIRTKIIQTVSQNGGHLSSNLGIVEITMAIHRVFNTPEDKLIFDVGHQAYPHKLLTGRNQQFNTLRTYGGLSGFPKCEESEYDCFETGHASTAISAALGMARARDELAQNHHVVAVVGDGALTGGMCYEALNDCGSEKTRLIIILNDNEMSIARNVGALSKHLSQLRSSVGWTDTKRRVKNGLQKLPGIGKPLQGAIHTLKKSIKSFFVDEGFFSALGFHYIGPIDGHNLGDLEKILEQAKHFDEPVIIHCATKKGYGYYGAERRPEQFHGTTPFFIESGRSSKKNTEANGHVAMETLLEMAKQDPSIVVVTAAMPLGTSTDLFQKVYPRRFFDVGIAEEHAVTLCAGMAKGGLHPFFCVYSTFLQRGYDQVMHDVCMQGLPVTLLLDRAGLAHEDGQSHQGLYDFAYLRHIPGITILAPSCKTELKQMIHAAHKLQKPCAIRYPKNVQMLKLDCHSFEIGKWTSLTRGEDATCLAVGSMLESALKVADALREQKGIAIQVINASTVKPLDEVCLRTLMEKGKPVFTLEEHALQGGFGSAVTEYFAAQGALLPVHAMGVADRFVPHGDRESLLALVGLDTDSILREIGGKLRGVKDSKHE